MGCFNEKLIKFYKLFPINWQIFNRN